MKAQRLASISVLTALLAAGPAFAQADRGAAPPAAMNCQQVNLRGPDDKVELVLSAMGFAGAAMFLILEVKAKPVVRAVHGLIVTKEAIALLRSYYGNDNKPVQICAAPDSVSAAKKALVIGRPNIVSPVTSGLTAGTTPGLAPPRPTGMGGSQSKRLVDATTAKAADDAVAQIRQLQVAQTTLGELRAREGRPMLGFPTHGRLVSESRPASDPTKGEIKPGGTRNLTRPPSPTIGQLVASFASIRGKVLDGDNEKAIHAAIVVLVNETAGSAQTAVSDADGDFGFAALMSGSYVLTISKLAYAPFTRKLSLKSGARTVFDVRLFAGRRSR